MTLDRARAVPKMGLTQSQVGTAVGMLRCHGNVRTDSCLKQKEFAGAAPGHGWFRCPPGYCVLLTPVLYTPQSTVAPSWWASCPPSLPRRCSHQPCLPCHRGSPGDLVIGEEKQKSECFLGARPCDKVTRAGLCSWTDLAAVSAVSQELCHLGKIVFLLFAVLRGKLGQVLLYWAVQGCDESVSRCLAIPLREQSLSQVSRAQVCLVGSDEVLPSARVSADSIWKRAWVTHTHLCPVKDPFGFAVAELVPGWMVPRRKCLVGERKFLNGTGRCREG